MTAPCVDLRAVTTVGVVLAAALVAVAGVVVFAARQAGIALLKRIVHGPS